MYYVGLQLCIMGFELNKCLINCRKISERNKNHFLLFKYTVVITFLAIGYDVLGEDFFITTGPWCWIKGCMEQDKVINWMALTGKGWEVATYFLTMTFYLIIKFYMVKRVRLHLYSLIIIKLYYKLLFL